MVSSVMIKIKIMKTGVRQHVCFKQPITILDEIDCDVIVLEKLVQ